MNGIGIELRAEKYTCRHCNQTRCPHCEHAEACKKHGKTTTLGGVVESHSRSWALHREITKLMRDHFNQIPETRVDVREPHLNSMYGISDTYIGPQKKIRNIEVSGDDREIVSNAASDGPIIASVGSANLNQEALTGNRPVDSLPHFPQDSQSSTEENDIQ